MSANIETISIDILERLSSHLNVVWSEQNHFETLSNELNPKTCGLEGGNLWNARFGTYWSHFFLLGGWNTESQHTMQSQSDLEKEAGNIISLLACLYATDEQTEHSNSRVMALTYVQQAAESYPGEAVIKPFLDIRSFWLTPAGAALKDAEESLAKWRSGAGDAREEAINSVKQAIDHIIWCLQCMTMKFKQFEQDKPS